MRKLWQGVVKTVFWSFERGSWPYDVMVIVIVAFVLLSPRHWFHDQTQSAAIPAAQVQLVGQDANSRTKTYRIQAGALPLSKRKAKASPELERETHDILGKNVDDLKGQTFQISQIDAVLADDGTVAYYDVLVKP